jgi:F-type H+-transporting ATPase subunit gamma
MAALKDIKRKVVAVQKTRQITKAMNMVAASKFKASQVRMENFRPYALKFMEVLNSLALRVENIVHPLLSVREPKNIWVISMTSDRGLCGGFNNNLIKATERFIGDKQAEGKEVTLIPIGKKGRDYFRKRAEIRSERVDVFRKFDMTLAASLAEEVIPPFTRQECDEIYLIYSEFVNVASQRPAVVKLFPLPQMGGEKESVPYDRRVNYLYEPSEQVLLEKLLPMYVHVLIFRALLETSAGENGARMVAMDNATRNCEDLISRLTLKYNKARQAAITAELMDIVGGTEALAKG